MTQEHQPSFQYAPKMPISTAAAFLGISVQAVHKQLRAKNLDCPKIGNKAYITHEIARSLFDIQFKRKIIACQIVKGGTGKTIALEHIASCANAYGAKVLKIDADPQGNLTDASGVDADNLPVLIDVIKGQASIEDSILTLAPGLDLLPSRIENVVLDNVMISDRLPLDKIYLKSLEPVINRYDFIFIDCPPTMGQAVTAATLAADIILAPLNPDKFSAKGLEILMKEIHTLNKNFTKDLSYKIFLNKFSGKTILSDKAVMSLLANPKLQERVLSTTVQFSQEIPNTIEENKTAFSHLRKSAVRDDFDSLTKELLEIKPNTASPINLIPNTTA